MAKVQTIFGTHFCGNEISDYGKQNDFVEKYAIKNPEIFQAEINKVKEQDELANLCVRSGIIQIVKCRY